jgi:putative aminopeptidase FrvX
MDQRPVQFLSALAAIPSTSFHEARLAACAARLIREIGLPLRVDPFGNLIVQYHHGRPRESVALVAHLDHPGIEIIAIDGPSTARGRLLGGVRPTYFDRPVPIQVVGAMATYPATIVGHEDNPDTERVNSLEISHVGGGITVGDFGVFDVPTFEEDGEDLAVRAADDLVGVAAILATLENLVNSGGDSSVFGILTRAEEVGLVGAQALARSRDLPDDTIVVSLECSPKRSGAEPGSGPVIRVGDRAQTFDHRAEAILLEARRRLPTTAIQRQLMDGGRCEAGAFLRHGYRTTGVAIPLTNYHNMGPNLEIVPERINRGDFLGEVKLLVEACAVAGRGWDATPDSNQHGDYYRERLLASAAEFRALEDDRDEPRKDAGLAPE